MKKVADQISDVLYERLSSPFAHSFIIAWIFINRALLLYLFTSGGVEFEIRLAKINSYINFLDGFVWPLLFTFISIAVYIVGSSVAYLIWEIFIISKKAIKDKLNKYNHLNEEDANILRDMNADLRKQKSEIQRDLENEISKLNDEIKYLKETHTSEIEKLNAIPIFEDLEHEESVEEERFIYKGGEAFSIDRAKWITFRTKGFEGIFNYLSDVEITKIIELFLKFYKDDISNYDDNNIKQLISFARELGLIDSNLNITEVGRGFTKYGHNNGY
jgi:hypothetical protein